MCGQNGQYGFSSMFKGRSLEGYGKTQNSGLFFSFAFLVFFFVYFSISLFFFFFFFDKWTCIYLLFYTLYLQRNYFIKTLLLCFNVMLNIDDAPRFCHNFFPGIILDVCRYRRNLSSIGMEAL